MRRVKEKSNQEQSNFKQQRQTNIDISVKQHHNQRTKDNKCNTPLSQT